MLFSRVFIYLMGILSAAYAMPKSTRSSHTVKERHTVPHGWRILGPACKSNSIHLIIGLKQRNSGVVEQHLLQISDPTHYRYGRHLTAEEIRDIVRPSEDTQNAVMNWLGDYGLTGHFNPTKDSVHVLLPVEKAEQLLQTSYTTFEHTDGSKVDRTPEWSLPPHLHDHIDFVQPTTSFFQASPQVPNHNDQRSFWSRDETQGKQKFGVSNDNSLNTHRISKICNVTFVTPDCIRTLYGTYDYVPQVPQKNGIGQTNFRNGTSYRLDILKALQAFRPEAAEAANTFNIINIADANDDQGPYTAKQLHVSKNLEADMDSEAILTVAWPIPLTVWQIGGDAPPFIPSVSTPINTNEPYLIWLDYVLSQKDLPYVISISFGDDEQTIPESYARRACSGFAQLGARGISLFAASGDAGVGENKTCISNDGKNTSRFSSIFPASCPWVTSVGGTEAFSPEVATTHFASGAGFSNYFAQPGYQNAAVTSYITSLNELHTGLYNSSGRAYPDVAANADYHAIVWNSTIQLGGGTSTSAPTFAAVIALVNDALLARGRPVLGFLNPWLYGGGFTALNDITTGSSYGCGTSGFPARKGWDAVTGWGTPDFSRLVQAALARKTFGEWIWCDILRQK